MLDNERKVFAGKFCVTECLVGEIHLNPTAFKNFSSMLPFSTSLKSRKFWQSNGQPGQEPAFDSFSLGMLPVFIIQGIEHRNR